MHSINYFGMSFAVDRATGIVLYTSRSNETVKFIVSSILDTTVVQHGDYITNKIDKNWFTNKHWIKHTAGGNFTEFTGEINKDLINKREIANIRARGYYLLIEQATIIGCSYDNLSDLSSDDLPMYILCKDRYIKEYSMSANVQLAEAEKHLQFLAECLLSAHYRKQTLIWKYSKSLRTVKTEEEFIKWRSTVLNETIGLGQV